MQHGIDGLHRQGSEGKWRQSHRRGAKPGGERWKTFDDLDVEIPCDNLSDRKDLLLAQSDIVVALPGGIGTLDEIFTVAASHTIGYHHKMVILYNMKGFWNSTIALLDDMQQKGMIRGEWHDYIEVANDLKELKKVISR